MNQPNIYYTFLSEVSERAFWHYYYTNISEEDRLISERYTMKRLKEYVVGRALLKTALRLEIGLDIPFFKLEKNRYGKPFLAEFKGIHFNISHSEDLIMVTISNESAVGLDVELVKNDYLSCLDVMDDVLSFKEIMHIQSLSTEEERTFSLVKQWTKKEAIMKADGRGFSYPLEDLEFCSPNNNYSLINNWWVRTFALEEEYLVSLASKACCDYPSIQKLFLT